ncbi:hypothetical protein LCGC14_2094770 [marine sediment metagenome]
MILDVVSFNLWAYPFLKTNMLKNIYKLNMSSDDLNEIKDGLPKILAEMTEEPLFQFLGEMCGGIDGVQNILEGVIKFTEQKELVETRIKEVITDFDTKIDENTTIKELGDVMTKVTDDIANDEQVKTRLEHFQEVTNELTDKPEEK